MKKYLMSGVAAIAFLAAFTSCSKSTDLYEGPKPEPTPEPTPVVKSDTEKLTDSFVKLIGGTIDPTNDWGFGATAAKAATRGQDNDGNNWGTYVKVPARLTADQIDKVTRYFTAVNKPDGISVNWSDYFVQQVSSTPNGPAHMNKLECKYGDTWEHIHNSNAGDISTYGNVCYDYTPIPGVDQNNWKKYASYKIQFMVEAGTESFRFHNSLDSKDYENFVIVPGDVIQQWDNSTIGTNGENADVSGMYFVGFDFEANGESASQQVARDYYFNDWIVQICPGLYYKDTWRCFAEDLIGTNLDDISISDWDFNDAVFDAYPAGNQTVIILRAAGGTLPLTVGGVEVHQAFGVDEGTMVNTENSTVDKPVAIFRINQTYTNLNNIEVAVNGTVLTAETGQVPMKLAVPVGTKWLKERVIITDGYPDFAKFAKNKNECTNWYETTVNPGALVNK